MNTAQYLVKKLQEIGVNDFFGLPGDYNFNILYAVENNPETNWIGCTNELNAGYAADGYARIKGYGALITTYGVGELSAINAIAGAYAENVPVVSIVGVPSTKNIQDKVCVHHNFQDVNYYACCDAHKHVTAAQAFLNKDNAKFEIDRMLQTLVKEKKPVYIAIPTDVAVMEISDNESDYNWVSNENNLNEAANRIAEKINRSQKPVILGDLLVKRFDSRMQYREFVEKLRAPVTNFFMGINLIDMDYDLYLGGYFAQYQNPDAQRAVNETDCLIAVGPVYTDLNSFGFNLPYKINDHIAIYGTHTYVEGTLYSNVKMPELLERITNLVEPKNMCITKPQIGYDYPVVNSETLTSEYIYPRLQEFFKENDIIIAETGIIPLGIAPMKLPANAEIQTQTLWGSIGWATPATLGACVAKPNSRVILITGEGSHQLTAMEIGNMLRRGLKPVVIVLNNKGYTIERVLSDTPQNSFNDIMQMSYSKFARAFEGDVWSTKVTNPDDFSKSLRVTRIMNKMCYIEICTGSMDMPKLTAKLFGGKCIQPDESLPNLTQERGKCTQPDEPIQNLGQERGKCTQPDEPIQNLGQEGGKCTQLDEPIQNLTQERGKCSQPGESFPSLTQERGKCSQPDKFLTNFESDKVTFRKKVFDLAAQKIEDDEISEIKKNIRELFAANSAIEFETIIHRSITDDFKD